MGTCRCEVVGGNIRKNVLKFIIPMDTQLHEHNKGRWVVHVKEVKCVLCELWLLKLKRFSLVYLFFFLNILFNSCSVSHDTLFLMDT